MRERIVTTLRLPPDVKAFLEEEARQNMSSQNSEIVRALRAHMRSRGVLARHADSSHHNDRPVQRA